MSVDTEFLNSFKKEDTYTERRSLGSRRLEDAVFSEKFSLLFDYFKETDKLRGERMNKLEQQIKNVDEKVDDLKADLPIIIKSSMEDVFKTTFWVGFKKFFKILGAVLVFTVITALVATIIPDLAEFLQNFSVNL